MNTSAILARSITDLERGNSGFEDTVAVELPNIVGREDSCQSKDSSLRPEENEKLESGLRIRRLFAKAKSLIPRKVPSPYDKFELLVRAIESCDTGYPYLSAFLDSGEDFLIYRRFGFLHSRLILQKQNELTELEKELDILDSIDLSGDIKALQKRRHDEERTMPVSDMPRTRKQLLNLIKKTLADYVSIVKDAQHMVALNRPPERDWKSVACFIMSKGPLVDGEADYIWHKEDLITLRPGREHAWLDTIVQKMIRNLPRKAMTWVFCQEGTRTKTTDELLFMPRRSSLKHLVNALVVFWVLILFTVPVYTLYFVGQRFDESNAQYSKIVSMVILFVATGIFAIGLALFTKAKRHETLASSAAYCALLVVFIANLGMNVDKTSKPSGTPVKA